MFFDLRVIIACRLGMRLKVLEIGYFGKGKKEAQKRCNQFMRIDCGRARCNLRLMQPANLSKLWKIRLYKFTKHPRQSAKYI